MDSLIDQRLAQLKKDAEARDAVRRSSSASPEQLGVFSISRERMEAVRAAGQDIHSVHVALEQFDFVDGTPAFFLELVFFAALTLAASDIHFEPEEARVRIRFRLDGVLYDVGEAPRAFYHLVVSRLKIIAGMQLNALKPHDGRFTVSAPERRVEIRASSTPSQFGETLVLRLLDSRGGMLTITDLGLRADDLALVMEEIMQPNGMILNTGPTGSGKTTTLYTFLMHRAKPEIKIITIEDPIEYQLPGIEQTEVRPDEGYSFANGLRSLVRQDPDILFIGEIRDQETAEIAIQAALTGHLVFSTIHSNDAVGAIPRLLDIGIKEASIGPALNVIMAQRLVRRLCSRCKKPHVTSPEEQAHITAFIMRLPQRVDRGFVAGASLLDPVGCPECRGTGYHGRIGLFELLKIGANTQGVPEVTMQQDGIIKALCGITTLEEVLGSTGPLMWE